MAYVYLIGQRDDLTKYKIGVTKGDISKRLKKLQTGNSEELYLVNSFETDAPFILETLLHKRYGHKKILNEWFMLDKKDVEDFYNVCVLLQKGVDALKDNCFFKKH